MVKDGIFYGASPHLSKIDAVPAASACFSFGTATAFEDTGVFVFAMAFGGLAPVAISAATFARLLLLGPFFKPEELAAFNLSHTSGTSGPFSQHEDDGELAPATGCPVFHPEDDDELAPVGWLSAATPATTTVGVAAFGAATVEGLGPFFPATLKGLAPFVGGCAC